jgi:hypothetical protein
VSGTRGEFQNKFVGRHWLADLALNLVAIVRTQERLLFRSLHAGFQISGIGMEATLPIEAPNIGT